jgi:hypothetical protein
MLGYTISLLEHCAPQQTETLPRRNRKDTHVCAPRY